MAKIKKPINIKEGDFTVKSVIMEQRNAPLEHRIAAMLKIEKTMDKLKEDYNQLKVIKETLEDSIKTIPYDTHCEDMVRRGVLDFKDQPFKVVVDFKDGSTYGVSVSGGVDEKFEINPALEAKSVDPEYQKITIALDKKTIKERFEAGTLPATIAMFCEKNPIDITKLKVTCERGPSTPEEKKEEEASTATV